MQNSSIYTITLMRQVFVRSEQEEEQENKLYEIVCLVVKTKGVFSAFIIIILKVGWPSEQ